MDFRLLNILLITIALACSIDSHLFRQTRQADNIDSLGIDGDYLNYAKYLMVLANNYTLAPDQLACVDIDPGKVFLMEFEDKEGIRMCDICPTLPFTKFKNLLVNVQPLEVHSNIPFSECFGACVARNECVAYSYDHESVVCYTFNATTGKFHSESNWTTVLMNQPTGIVNRWVYSRHTVITNSNGTTPLQTSTETSFLNCLSRCVVSGICKAVSYTFASRSCLQFASVSKDSGNYVDFKYGVVAAFDIESVNVANQNKWRFIEETRLENDASDGNATLSAVPTTSSKCTSPGDGLGAFYAMKCLTVEALGCDSKTGCQTCYYPEKTNEYRRDLIICQDSTFINGRNQKEKLAACYKDCLSQRECIAIDFDPSQLTCDIIRYSSWHPKDPYNSVRRFRLKFSKSLTNLHQFSILPNRSLAVTTESKTHIEEIATNDLDKCLAACIQRPFCTKVAFSKTKCLMTSTSARTTEVQSANADSIVFIREANLTSPMLTFKQMPGWKLTGKSKATEEYSCGGKDCSDLLLPCTNSCLSKYSKWCNIISVDFEANKVICNLFNGTEDTDLIPSQSSEVFTRYFQTDFSLQNLISRDEFEEKDFYNCFTNSTSSTLSAVAGYDSILFDNGKDVPNNTFLARRKRGLFSSIGNFFKKAAKAVVNVVKDTVKTVVDTAKGVVNTVGKVFQGDLNGAKDAFLKIPIVKDVKEAGENIIKIGKSVVKGDWESVGDAALGLATSNLVDFIPGVGRVVKTGGKALKDGIGKGAKRGGKDADKNTKDDIGNQASKDRINRDGNSDKPDKDRPNNNNDQNDSDRCKRANPRSKPGSSSNCNNQDLKCYKPNIENVMGISLKDCGMRKEGGSCTFFCEPGYMEEDRGRMLCKSKSQSKKADWDPTPRCALELCSRVSKFHTIPIKVPIDLGKLPDRVAYVSYYDEARRLPVWSVALHDAVNVIKGFGRKATAGFIPHPCSIKQATAVEYKSSGWHQGHLTPINVMLYHHKAAKASNLFINIAPQSPTINTGAWKVLEMKIQCYTKTVPALVATGVCHDSLSATLSPGNLAVPSCFWKMICYKDQSDNTVVVGFVGPNEKLAKTDKDKKKKARENIATPQSQKSVKDFVSGGNPFYMGSATSDPWLISAKSIYSSPSTAMIDVTKCSQASTLDPATEKEWKDRLAPKVKSGRRKRDIRVSGCTAEEEEELAALYGFDGFDLDDDEIDNLDETEEDDTNGGGGKFAGATCGKRLIGYYPSWGDKEITYQQASRLTHIVYAFFETKSDGSIVLGSADPTHSPDPGNDAAISQKRLAKLMKIAQASSNLQVLFAVGGWENSQYFSSIAANPNSRMNFIANTIKTIQEHNFDGIDVDWEYPVTGGAQEGVPNDKENYVQLMKELRQALDQHQRQIGRTDPFLISFAGAAGQWTLDPGFDLPGLLQYASWVNVMTYDYFGAWGSKWGAYTGPPAPLFFAMPPRFSGKTNVDWTIKYYVCRSNQPHKINMGVPFYGRFWRNVGAPIDSSDNMWRLAEQVGGKFDGGYEPWRKLKEGWLNDPSFEKSFHDKAKAPYAFNAAQRIFLGYEDPRSLKFKVDYAAEHNLGGLMIWAIDQDDDQNTMLNTLVDAPLCKNTDPKAVLFKCSPINDKRWWTSEDGDDVAGLCGRSAPMYKGYYPVCDPDDPGYSCCGAFGYCGTGDDYCKCPSCVDFRNFPERILDEPVRPSVPVQWYFLNAEDGKRGRCGRDIPKINNEFPICNPDDSNAHCCSNGGYCGNKPEHCQCSGCIDFKIRKDYRYGPRKWWIVADGEDKAGKCGPQAPLINGAQAECNPDDPGFHCCSPSGFCGSTPDYCDCQGCVNFKKS